VATKKRKVNVPYEGIFYVPEGTQPKGAWPKILLTSGYANCGSCFHCPKESHQDSGNGKRNGSCRTYGWRVHLNATCKHWKSDRSKNIDNITGENGDA